MRWPWQLYHWHFEVSGKCTLKCPRCPRNESLPVPWLNKELDLNFFKKNLDFDLLKNQIKRITFCGDIGDPIYASEFLDIVEYIKNINPKIHIFTITNGSHRKSSWWDRFAEISDENDTINFSVDGFDHKSNNLYRIRSDWQSIMDAMDIMCVKSKIFVNWATIIFAFNQDHLGKIENLAKAKGCDGFQLTYSTKFGSKYGETYGGQLDILEPRPEYVSSTHRYQRHLITLSHRAPPIQNYLNENQKHFFEIQQQHNQFITPMCKIGNRGIYISADGVLHPCSWVSYPYTQLSTDRKTIKFRDSFHQMYRDRFDLNKRSLHDVLSDEYWCNLYDSFDSRNKAWVECEQKCHKSLVNQEYAVGWLTN